MHSIYHNRVLISVSPRALRLCAFICCAHNANLHTFESSVRLRCQLSTTARVCSPFCTLNPMRQDSHPEGTSYPGNSRAMTRDARALPSSSSSQGAFDVCVFRAYVSWAHSFAHYALRSLNQPHRDASLRLMFCFGISSSVTASAYHNSSRARSLDCLVLGHNP